MLDHPHRINFSIEDFLIHCRLPHPVLHELPGDHFHGKQLLFLVVHGFENSSKRTLTNLFFERVAADNLSGEASTRKLLSVHQFISAYTLVDELGVWGLGFGVWGLGFGRSEER